MGRTPRLAARGRCRGGFRERGRILAGHRHCKSAIARCAQRRAGESGIEPQAASPAALDRRLCALLRPRKGLETLLEAASLAHVHNPSLRLRIVGRFETSEYEHDILNYANKLNLSDIIEWRRFRQRVDTELDAMDILAFPSILPEGMPMVLLEAMAAGVPIVASRVSGVVDLLQDREDSVLVPPADPAALSAALNLLFATMRFATGCATAAFIRQRKCFSDDIMSKAVAKIYRDILFGRELGGPTL